VEDLPFNYGLAMQGAEEVASHVVDKILTGGGLVMYQKYIEAKSLLFAKDATRDVLMSNLEMCFIPFDDGEIDQTIDGHCWDIEEEPVPQNIDSWAANHLCTAKQQARPPMLSAADKERRRLEEAERKRKKSMNVVKPKKEKKDEGKSTTRLFPLPDNTEPDEEAERYRLLKAEDKKKLQEKAKADAIKAKENEKEQIKMEALSAQMKDQPHTWDHLGNVIWIEHPRPDKLPALQATANAKIKADPRARREEGGKDTMNSTAGSNLASTAGKGKGKGKGDDKKKKKNRGGDDSDYTDGFAPLKGGQPDVIETMDVKSGVLLEVKSRKKMGRPVDGGERTMSRKEYVRLAEHEMSGGKDDETRPQPGGGGAYASTDMPAAAGSKSPGNKAGRQASPSFADEQPDAAVTPTGAGGGGVTLPAIDKGRGPAAAAGGGAPPSGPGPKLGGSGMAPSPDDEAGSRDGSRRGTDAADRGSIQMAPRAPPPQNRSKYDTIGHLARPPRFHAASLGGPYMSTGTAQPPLGATMGHGLHHMSGDKFFYPPDQQPGSPAFQLSKSQSEGKLVRGLAPLPSLTNSPSAGAIRPMSAAGLDGEDIGHGVLRIDKKSAAYNIVMRAMGT